MSYEISTNEVELFQNYRKDCGSVYVMIMIYEMSPSVGIGIVLF